MRTAASQICAQMPKNEQVGSLAQDIKSLEMTASQKVLMEMDGLKRQLSEAEQALIVVLDLQGILKVTHMPINGEIKKK